MQTGIETSQAIQLRRASSDDAALIFELAKQIWNDHYIHIITQEQIDYMLDWMYSSKSLIEQMNEKGHQFYLIQNADGKYIGFIAFSGKEGDYFIHKFYISTDKQAKGIGTAVFEQFKSFIGDIKTIRLTVNRKNFKSINFYFKNGFIIEKVEDFDIGHGWLMEDFVMIYKA
mgnify:CR=1 FL=1